ncbi:hypothetical protein Hanom_Chr13g01207321 [Helianthus anomalus]
MLVDSHESTPSKYPSKKKRKTGEGSSKDALVNPTPVTQPPPQQAPRRPRRLSKEIRAGPANEIYILKHQVNYTNVL